MKNIETDPKSFGTLLVCSMRYAMGRMTYMPSEIQRQIRRHWLQLEDGDRNVLRRDLTEAIARNSPLGMAFDHREWVELLEFMNKAHD